MAYLRVGLARVGHYCTTWVRRRAYLTSLIEPIALFEFICGLKPTTAKFIAWLLTQLDIALPYAFSLCD
jgi:hypothetical protein